MALGKSDVVTVKVPFARLPVGMKGVCIEVGARNGVPVWSVLMTNQHVITILGREVDIFFRRSGKLSTMTDDRQQLIRMLEDHTT